MALPTCSRQSSAVRFSRFQVGGDADDVLQPGAVARRRVAGDELDAAAVGEGEDQQRVMFGVGVPLQALVGGLHLGQGDEVAAAGVRACGQVVVDGQVVRPEIVGQGANDGGGIGQLRAVNVKDGVGGRKTQHAGGDGPQGGGMFRVGLAGHGRQLLLGELPAVLQA